MADVLPQRISPLHRRHLSLGAQMTSEKGWQRPARYASAQEEAAAVQSGAGLCDITPVGKLLLQGADIEASVRASLPGVEIPAPGGVTRHEDRHLFCRLAVDQLLLLTPPDATDDIQATMATTQPNTCAHLVDTTSGLTGLCLAGPRSQDVLSKLTDLDLTLPATADMTCTQTSLSGVLAILVRADFGDVPCYRIFVSRDLGEFAWDVLTEAGSSEGLTPFGVDALRLLREGA